MALVDLNEALFYSKLIIHNGDPYSGKKFREYSKGYLTTNEHISAYLSQEEYNKNRALTVLASGDHVFNLICDDVKEIDAFDINKLEYYVFCLKKAAIKNLSLDDYMTLIQSFYCWHIITLQKIIEILKKDLPEDVYEYFRIILEYCKEVGRLGNLYIYNYKASWMRGNAYLRNEDNYLVLRKKLEETNVNLYFGDVRSLPDRLSGFYDLILLSNIADYFGKPNRLLTLEEYQKFVQKYYNLLNDDGLIINYLFGAFDNFHPSYPFAIADSKIMPEDLGRENIIPINDDEGESYFRIRKKKGSLLWP